MTIALMIMLIGAVVLMGMSVDNQLQRIERKINTMMDDIWDLLDERKDKGDEG